jgi:hypothetical protein
LAFQRDEPVRNFGSVWNTEALIELTILRGNLSHK